MLNGFAYHKIILNSDGKPIDYIFIEINKAFEKLTGLKREEVIGKKVTEVIPEIVKMKKQQGSSTIRVWSAGCSTGEEPYSIVICFLKKLGIEFEKFDVKVIATDYDNATVEKAKEGKYEDQQFREMPKGLREKFFHERDGFFYVRDHIKSRVEFYVGDILKPEKPDNIDIIFCRNTVIYFEGETKGRLYVEFHDLLNQNGFFIMGKTETLNGPAREMFKIFNGRERIYRKE